MKIKEIRINNFRSIKEVVVNPSRFNVLVGQNNHGKSNFFEAVEWFYGGKGNIDEYIGGYQDYLQQRPDQTAVDQKSAVKKSAAKAEANAAPAKKVKLSYKDQRALDEYLIDKPNGQIVITCHEPAPFIERGFECIPL